MSAALHQARALLADALGLSPSEVGDESSVHTLGSWDSLGHLRIVVAIEQRTGNRLNPEQILALNSVSDIARLL